MLPKISFQCILKLVKLAKKTTWHPLFKKILKLKILSKVQDGDVKSIAEGSVSR